MKKNFNVPLLGYNGQPLKEHDGDTIMVKNAIINALDAENTGDGSAKLRRFNIALKVAADIDDYDIDELALIKECVGKYMPTLVCGRVLSIIEE